MASPSWHIPGLGYFHLPPPSKILHVVFLQRLPAEEIDQILEALSDVEVEWARSVDTDIRPRKLESTPWIRDYWPSSSTIVAMLSNGIKNDRHYHSFIMVDSGWEAATVIAARWEYDSTGERRIVAARVPMGDANILLTLCDRGSVPSLIDAIGEAQYEESKMDFYDDAAEMEKRLAVPAAPEYQPPSFLPEDLALSNSRLVIVSLIELSDDEVEAIKEVIGRDPDGEQTDPTEVIIHIWEGPSPSRQDLFHIYNWMKRNSPEDCQGTCAFFIDNILQDEEDRPRTLAVTDAEQPFDQSMLPITNNGIVLVPVTTEKLRNILKEAPGIGSLNDFAEEYGDPCSMERVVDLRQPLEWPLENSCTVFYLEPLSVEQERTARRALANSIEPSIAISLCYLGYVWPSGTEKHTVQDLRDLFEKCDPRSPYFDPTFSNLRMLTYPNEFVAVDLRVSTASFHILESNESSSNGDNKLESDETEVSSPQSDSMLESGEPKVLMGATLDFSNGTGDNLGWIVGTTDASQVGMNYIQFDVANAGPEECFENCEKLWLSDLSTYRDEDWDE